MLPHSVDFFRCKLVPVPVRVTDWCPLCQISGDEKAENAMQNDTAETRSADGQLSGNAAYIA